MTAISSSVGTAPLSAPPPSTAGPDLYAALAAGTNLGGDVSGRDSFTFEDLNGTAPAPPLEPQATTTAPTTTGGGGQATDGASTVDQAQVIAALKQAVDAVNALVAALRAQGGVTGGGAPGSGTPGGVGACGMPGCDMDHGADASPTQSSGSTKAAAKKPKQQPKTGHAAGHAAAAGQRPLRSAPAAAATTDPSNVSDKTGLTGLTAASRRGLVEAHKYGLPLVSGKRSGNGDSDHDSGNAIDVGTLPIGAPSSNGATKQMQAFREHMRALGKAGKLNVKYIISDGRIASATSDWNWRPYIYPGMTAASVAALKKSNLGEYNRLEHFDHVHVSFS